jgi:hypothetical protein
MKVEVTARPVPTLFGEPDASGAYTGTIDIKTVIRFRLPDGTEVARIDEDGMFRCQVEPTDENARRFIACINSALDAPKLAGVAATPADAGGQP